jgi:hypothetical protein
LNIEEIEDTSSDGKAFRDAIAAGWLLAKYVTGNYPVRRLKIGCQWCSDATHVDFLNTDCNGKENSLVGGMVPETLPSRKKNGVAMLSLQYIVRHELRPDHILIAIRCNPNVDPRVFLPKANGSQFAKGVRAHYEGHVDASILDEVFGPTKSKPIKATMGKSKRPAEGPKTSTPRHRPIVVAQPRIS